MPFFNLPQAGARPVFGGDGPPAESFGLEGDLYLDRQASQLYGPKQQSGWGTPLNLVGATGATGATGSTGAQGEQGTAATITVGTTTTTEAGDDAAVTNVGTSLAAVLNFAIPRGAIGPQGPEGPVGPPGASVSIAGTVATAADLPAPDSVAANTAYVTANNGNLHVSNGVDAWIDVGPFRGPTGPQGPQGPVGPQGPQGTLAGHTHPISDIVSLQATLDGKAAISHTHNIADITGLQDALDNAGGGGGGNATISLTPPEDCTAIGTAGALALSANHLFVCHATNQWKRIPLEAFGTCAAAGTGISWTVQPQNQTSGASGTPTYTFNYQWNGQAASNNPGPVGSGGRLFTGTQARRMAPVFGRGSNIWIQDYNANTYQRYQVPGVPPVPGGGAQDSSSGSSYGVTVTLPNSVMFTGEWRQAVGSWLYSYSSGGQYQPWGAYSNGPDVLLVERFPNTTTFINPPYTLAELYEPNGAPFALTPHVDESYVLRMRGYGVHQSRNDVRASWPAIARSVHNAVTFFGGNPTAVSSAALSAATDGQLVVMALQNNWYTSDYSYGGGGGLQFQGYGHSDRPLSYVVIGDDGRLSPTRSHTALEVGPAGTQAAFHKVIYAAGRWFALGRCSNIRKSNSSPPPQHLPAVMWSLMLQCVATSTNGLVWDLHFLARNTPSTTANPATGEQHHFVGNDMAYGNGRLVVVGSRLTYAHYDNGGLPPGEGTRNVFVSTDNGQTWARHETMPTSTNWRAVVYLESTSEFMATSADDALVAFSSDGVTWRLRFTSEVIRGAVVGIGAASTFWNDNQVAEAWVGVGADFAVIAGAGGVSSATFTAQATSPASSSIAYQWQVSTDGGTSWANISGATSSSYTISPVSSADNGKRFRARATAGDQIAFSNSALLTVS